MLSLIKNSFFIFSFLLVACNDVTISNPDKTIVIKSDKVSSAPSFTILQSGLPPPPLYTNAEDIVLKKYNVVNIFAAGCIVSERLGDSIETYNMASFHEMNKYYKTDMQERIYYETNKEHSIIKQLDSLLKIAPELKDRSWAKDVFPYFVKTPGNYAAYYIVNSADNKSGDQLQKLKLLVILDSTSKKITGILEKDSLIKTEFKELQHD
jgi:hypothetical protein